jgi:NADH:ubiquinone oxidoreductase subunit C
MQNYFLKLFLNYRNYLKQVFPQLNGYFLNGELFIKVPVNKLLNIIYFLKNHTQSQFKILSDICALDFP